MNILKWDNRYISPEQQNIGSRLDGCEPIVFLDETQVSNLSLNVTGLEYTKLLSALHSGLDLFYPDEKLDLLALFLEAAHCPPQLTEQGDCIAYPLWSPFITWFPVNPFNDPNTIPNGFVQPPFIIHDGGGSLPPAYNVNDVILPLGSLSVAAFTVSSTAPRLEIRVTGSGQIEIDFLSIAAGGRLLVGIDNPPDLTDILAGIFDPNTETLLELNLDSSSFPPEDDVTVQHEIDITAGAGVETVIYLTWLPTIDLNEFPVQYGGGIRSIQLCGFEQEAASMGITDVRINAGILEYFIDGAWVVVGAVLEDCDDVEACLPTSPTIIAMNAATALAQAQADLALANAALAQAQADLAFAETQDNASLIANLQVQGSNVDSQSFKRFDWVDYASDAWLTDVSDFLVNIPANFDRVRLLFTAYSTNAALTAANLFANGNLVQSKYQSESAAGHFSNTPRIGWLPPAAADGVVEQILEIEFRGITANTRTMALSTASASPAGGAVGSATDFFTWQYEEAETLNNVTLKPASGNLKAFGGVKVQVWQEVTYVTDVINQTPIEEPQPPQPNPQGLIVDFDTGYTDYELQLVQPNDQQALIQGGGNLGNAAINRRTDLATVANFVKVNLPVPSTVIRASFDYASTTEGGEGFTEQTAAIDFYDSGDNLLHTTNLHKVTQVAVFDTWHNHEVVQTYNNVAYIVCRGTTEAEFIAILETLIDNIEIDYTEV